MAKYLLAIYDDEAAFASASPEDAQKVMAAYYAFGEEAETSGAFLAGEGLQPSMTARTVAAGGHVSDGPFADTREQLGGFYLLECANETEAIEWAKKIPSVSIGTGTVEVRPVQEFPPREERFGRKTP